MGTGGGDRIDASRFGASGFTVPEVLDTRAARCPDRVMLSIDGVEVTYAQMRDMSLAAARALRTLGVGRGDSVALFAGTSAVWVSFWLGAARLGAVPAAVNTANRGDFLVHALRLARAMVVLTDAAILDRLLKVADEVATLTAVVVQDDSPTTGRPGGPDIRSARALMSGSGGGALPKDEASEADVAVFYTSGTTGASKAVATSWHYLFTVAANAVAAWNMCEEETLWSAMPLFHLSAAPLILAPMLVGGTTVLRSGFHPAQVWDDVRAWDAAGFVGVGAMVSMLWSQPRDPRDFELPLRFISAAPVPSEIRGGIEERYGCAVVTMYGMTEVFPLAATPIGETGPPGTAGRLNPDFDVRIVDDQGKPLPTGQTGEIVCRPRRPRVMSDGYLVSPDESAVLAVAAHPEWFDTGDLGRIENADGDEYLAFVDRKKDAMRRRGENVSSVEVETVVTRHPAVAEVAVVGVPSDLGEDDILAVMTVVPGCSVDPVDLLDFCSERMPYFCVPRYVEVLDELPKNAIGRVRKDILRTRGIGPHAWDRERHNYVLNR